MAAISTVAKKADALIDNRLCAILGIAPEKTGMGQPIRPARFAPLKSWRDADLPLAIRIRGRKFLRPRRAALRGGERGISAVTI
jgi:hypothetical protein